MLENGDREPERGGRPVDPTGRSSAPRYPDELEGDGVTVHGDVVHLRPIRPEDAPALIRFHQGLSPQSVYRRFFFVHPTLSSAEAARFTRIDYVDRLALVAEADGQMIAVGRYERVPGTNRAEVAFVVADAYHHHGFGTLLLATLAGAARDNGITRFVAQTLAGNTDMMGVFTGSGFPVTTSTEYGIVNVEFPIEPQSTH